MLSRMSKLGIGMPLGSALSAMPKVLKPFRSGSTPFLPKGVAGTAADPRKRFLRSAQVGNVGGFNQATQGIKLQKFNPASMMGTKLSFATSEYSGPLSTGRFMARHPLAMSGAPMMAPPRGLTEAVKSAGPPPQDNGPNPGEEGRAYIPEKRASLSWAVRNAIEAVGEWEKGAAVPTTPAGRLANSQQKGQPKVTAPPGPSIAQIAKPVGFGQPLAGATKSAGLSKVALLEELVRVGLRDVPGTPRLIMRSRSPKEREVLGRLARKKYNLSVTHPLMRTAEKGISKLPGERPKSIARAGAKMLARDPLGQLAANLVPIPGASAGYEGLKAGLSKAINVVDPAASRVTRLARATA